MRLTDEPVAHERPLLPLLAAVLVTTAAKDLAPA
jgi:hypothetical protein